jgi:hypothetical protein
MKGGSGKVLIQKTTISKENRDKLLKLCVSYLSCEETDEANKKKEIEKILIELNINTTGNNITKKPKTTTTTTPSTEINKTLTKSDKFLQELQNFKTEEIVLYKTDEVLDDSLKDKIKKFIKLFRVISLVNSKFTISEEEIKSEETPIRLDIDTESIREIILDLNFDNINQSQIDKNGNLAEMLKYIVKYIVKPFLENKKKCYCDILCNEIKEYLNLLFSESNLNVTNSSELDRYRFIFAQIENLVLDHLIKCENSETDLGFTFDTYLEESGFYFNQIINTSIDTIEFQKKPDFLNFFQRDEFIKTVKNNYGEFDNEKKEFLIESIKNYAKKEVNNLKCNNIKFLLRKLRLLIFYMEKPTLMPLL